MSILIDSLADFFTRHPTAQVVAAYVVKALGGLFALVLISGCLFLAFGSQKAFFYRKGSLVDKCWKAGWLLQIVGVAGLSYQFFLGSKNFSLFEVILNCIPLMLLLFAQMYGSKYHITCSSGKGDAKQKLS